MLTPILLLRRSHPNRQKSSNKGTSMYNLFPFFRRHLFLLLISTFSPFILLEDLYLALKDDFIQQKHDLRNSRVSADLGTRSLDLHRGSPKGPRCSVPRTQSTSSKRNRVTAKHKIMLKKSTRKRIKTQNAPKAGNRQKCTQSRIKDNFKY